MSEHQHLEWKASWRDEYLKWVCAFANAEGGTLVIGRNDRGEAVGLPDARRLLEELPNKIRDLLGLVVPVNLREVEGKQTIEIVVAPMPYPVSYKGEYHVRSGSTRQELKGAALDQFLLRKQGLHWDAVPVPGVSPSTLSAQSLARFRQRAARSGRLAAEWLDEADALLLERLRLTAGEYLKRAAVLLFHPDPEAFVGGAWIKLGAFETDADLRFQDEVHGPLMDQVEQALTILKAKYLKALISYEGLQRVETLQVPEPALREALLNAVVHKDYSSAIPVQISVYPDRLMIWNPGQLPPEWTVEKLLAKHASVPFNPDIANAFFRAGQIESWGRGIERMLDACRAVGAPAPSWRHDATGLWIDMPFLQPPATSAVTGADTTQVTTQVATQVSLLRALHGEMSPQALQTALGLKNDRHFRKNVLRPALEAGLIERTIPDKPNSRLQKYRLTSKGAALLVTLESG